MGSRMAKGCLYAVISAVIYGSMPLMAKYIYADGVNSLTLVFLRNLFSIIPLAFLAYREQKTLKISLSLIPPISLIALLGCCMTPVLLFSSYSFMPSGLATVFHFAYPSFVILMEVLFLHKSLRPVSVISILLCIAGISLFYEPGQTLHPVGSILALLSGMTFATYVVLLSLFDKRRLSGFLFTFYIVLISTILTLVICIAANSLAFPSTIFGWGLCVLFSLLVTTCATVLFQQSIFLIGGEVASILSTLEPITSVMIGVIIFQEPFGLRLFLGTVLVITASVITVLYNIWKHGKQRS